MTIRKCKRCGQEFEPRSNRQQYCNREVVVRCEICGKEIHTVCSYSMPSTCSENCDTQLKKIRRQNNSKSEIRECKWCGQLFQPKTVRDRYCNNAHYKVCEVCGKQFEVDVRRNPTVRSCSDECKKILQVKNRDFQQEHQNQVASLMKKYGVDNAMKIPGAVDNIRSTNQAKYGTDWYTQTQEYKDRVVETSRNNYGVDHFLKSKEVIDKRVKTVNEMYGVDNVFQAESVKEKCRETILSNYGVENVSQSEAIQTKIRNNNIAKYGVSHPMMLPEFKDKAIQTNIEKYGRVAYTQQHIENIQDWYMFIDNPSEYIESHYEHTPTTRKLAEDLGVDTSTIDVYLNRKDAFGSVRRAKSIMEEEITDTIHSWLPSCTVVNNTRSIIHPDEIDIYLPEYKLGIECNPTCTHNSSVSDPWGGSPKSHSYHKNKSDMCESKGIFLFHVFGYEWKHNKDVVLSMLKNLLKVNSNKIYGRQCIVREVSSDESIRFLNENHRQGSTNSKVRLGLYCEDELVSLMTFGKMRNTIGTGSENLDDCWELVRFCSKLNTSVIGGADKLFKHFIKMFNPTRVRSFSDRAHTRGNLYSTLGFKEIRRSDASYVWVNVVSDIAYNRVNAQKKNLSRFLHEEVDLTKSEKQIMEEHGYVRVYDSGTITWEWTNDKV